jgi:hypothetical protein
VIDIGGSYRVSLECKSYRLDTLPHKAAIKKLAGQIVKVIGHDGNGGPSFRSYKVISSNNQRCWCWARELEEFKCKQ